nr:MAG TPA: hypothetical protein [Caudoviricetes sp.]
MIFRRLRLVFLTKINVVYLHISHLFCIFA